MCVCVLFHCATAPCVFFCGGCFVCVCVCIRQCVHHTLTLAAGRLQYLPAALLLCYTPTDTHTPPLSLPVSHVGEWSRCWGPIVAQCHFLVLLISSLCCRWLSLKGSTHMLTQTHTGTPRHTHSYLLTSPSAALLPAPQWQQRLWLSA